MKEWFEDWFDSPYYHLLYQHRNDEEAFAFVERLTTWLNPAPMNTLLDLACGKGRHARAFSAHQLDVTGLDLSPQSIEHAKQFETEHLHFYVHDMRNVFRTNYFDFTCNLFTSFGYFKSAHDNQLAARSMSQGLKPGGKLVIDFVNQSQARRNIEASRQETIHRDHIRFDIERSYTDTQLLKKISIQDGDLQACFTETVNSFTCDAMSALFEAAGLKRIEQFGTYTLDAYDEEHSPRMILVFTK
jgi:SAM-dependent methyltransferase